MSNIPERVMALLERAGHVNTPVHESHSCAVQALKLIYNHKLKIVSEVENKSTESPRYSGDDFWNTPPFDPSQWKEVELFHNEVAKGIGTCKKCNQPYNTGEIVATSRDNGSTHYRCRHYWTKQT